MYLYVFTHLVIHINVSIQGGNKGGRGGNESSRGEEEAIYMTLLCFSGSLSPHLPVKTHKYDW